MLADTMRLFIPVVAPMITYVSAPNAKSRWTLSKTYPPELICQVMALVILLLAGAAWSKGDPSTARDITFLILTVMICASIYLNGSKFAENVVKTQNMLNVAAFFTAFLIYSAAMDQNCEKVLLAPLLVALLLDTILSLQSVSSRLNTT